MNDTQNQIIRQSSLKASIDFWNLKCNGKCEDITESDIIKTASHFGYWCANGKEAQNINNKLLK
jgi:hypothetical protein|tara:strand:+ start:806 stop:997 length:192 start_codon:yes stop_codon:yes gene_type:complete